MRLGILTLDQRRLESTLKGRSHCTRTTKIISSATLSAAKKDGLGYGGGCLGLGKREDSII
eukprot:7768620-Prorocentrum_lima.AAC.1